MQQRASMTGKRTKAAVVLIVLLAAFALSACAAVKPYERGTLSHPLMQVTPRLGDTYRPHILAVREGSIGGEGSAGAGCGCN